MGLAILPARLAKELVMLEKAMLSGENLNDIPELAKHTEWAEAILEITQISLLKTQEKSLSKRSARRFLRRSSTLAYLNVINRARMRF